MQRIDAKYSQLTSKLVAAANLPPEEKAEIEKQVKEREAYLMPLLHQVAVHFADLHDTPERMLEKGCISVSFHVVLVFCELLSIHRLSISCALSPQEIVPWRKSRKILYMRLKRVLLENRILKDLMEVKTDLSDGQAKAMLRRWFIEDQGEMEVCSQIPSRDVFFGPSSLPLPKVYGRIFTIVLLFHSRRINGRTMRSWQVGLNLK